MRSMPSMAGQFITAASAGRRWKRGWALLLSRATAGLSLMAALLVGMDTLSPAANGQRASQDQVEAAYLYNFGKFVRWPDAGRGPLQICVAGQDVFAEAVSRLTSGEEIEGRPLQTRLLDRPEAAAGCSILFVEWRDRAHPDPWLAATAGKPVLTVGDGPDFLNRGGMIQFVLVDDHVRFSVNLDAANRCGVGLSSELLKVAVRVIGKPEKGGPQ